MKPFIRSITFRTPFSCMLLLSMVCTSAFAEPRLDLIRLPEGFKIEVYAGDLLNARSMALSPNGTLFVGTRAGGRGQVYAVVDEDGDFKADKVYTLAERLNMPNGVVFHEGSLYVMEVHRLLRYDNIEANLANPPEPVVIDDTFPTEKHHGWKYLALGPDNMLYTNIGAPCNMCDEGDPFATIVRFNLDGSGREIFARGVRNSVGFTWHPDTNEMWFTDNNRDMMGDNRPPCELNHAPRPGMHFGYPYVHGQDILDPEYGVGHDPADYTPPAMDLGPHVAPLGLKFYTGDMFPEKYRNHLFIAERGSWNRSIPIGYRVSFVRVENGKATDFEVFADGWLQGMESWGRIVDVLIMPDGSMLVSDDTANCIYRISYEG